jgi:hypothetical protein
LVIRDTNGHTFGSFAAEGWSDTSGPFVDSKCAFVFKWDPSQRHFNTYRHAQADALMRVAAASEGGGVGVGSGSNARNCGREGAPGEMEANGDRLNWNDSSSHHP